MKNITKFTCLALGAAFITTAVPVAFSASAPGGCCGAMTPMADEAKPDAKAKEYPLTTCVVSGEKLGEMGDPFVFKHDGQEVKLCCKNCKKKFDKDPDTYMKKLKDAPAKK